MQKLIKQASVVLMASSLLVSCSSEAEPEEPEELIVSTSQTPTAEATEQKGIIAPSLKEPVEDPAMGVTMHYQGTTSSPYGGMTVMVAVRNDNEEPLTPETLGEPTLTYAGSTAPLSEATASAGGAPVHVPLDLPLGAGATTNLQYTFNVNYADLNNAEFTLGNITFEGNLNSV